MAGVWNGVRSRVQSVRTCRLTIPSRRRRATMSADCSASAHVVHYRAFILRVGNAQAFVDVSYQVQTLGIKLLAVRKQGAKCVSMRESADEIMCEQPHKPRADAEVNPGFSSR